MHSGLILLAAGEGKRLGNRRPKALSKIEGKPLFIYSLLNFQKLKFITQIILVIPQGYEDAFKKALSRFQVQVHKIIAGGSRRVDSVINGVLACENCEYIFIHDSARPFATPGLLRRLYYELKKYQAVVPAEEISFTIKHCQRGFVVKTLQREGLYQIQTPQAFKFEVLKTAILNYKKKKLTRRIYDDAQLVELLNQQVRIISGERLNIKITYPQDLKLAKIIARLWK